MSSDLGTESHNASSPQSVAESATSSVYPVNFSSSTLSPSLVQVTSGFDPKFATTLAGPTPGYPAMATPYRFRQTFQPDQMLLNEPSWDFNVSSRPEDFDDYIPYTMA
jgi:hypothetical protein